MLTNRNMRRWTGRISADSRIFLTLEAVSGGDKITLRSGNSTNYRRLLVLAP